MPRIQFTPNLQRHLDAPPRRVEGETVRAVLEATFEDHPRLESYVLNDQGELREHMSIFVDGEPVKDRTGLTDAVSEDAEIYVLQALSGGSGKP